MGTATCIVWSIIGLDKVVSCMATINSVPSARYQLGSGPWVSNAIIESNWLCSKGVALQLLNYYLSILNTNVLVYLYMQLFIIFITGTPTFCYWYTNVGDYIIYYTYLYMYIYTSSYMYIVYIYHWLCIYIIYTFVHCVQWKRLCSGIEKNSKMLYYVNSFCTEEKLTV